MSASTATAGDGEEKSRLDGSIWVEQVDALVIGDQRVQVEDFNVTTWIKFWREPEGDGFPTCLQVDEAWVSFKRPERGETVFVPLAAVRGIVALEEGGP